MSTQRQVYIGYTYYSHPWKESTGDEIRINKLLAKFYGREVPVIMVVSSPHRGFIWLKVKKGSIIYYLSVPRTFYRMLSNVFRWKNSEDLNLMHKLTLYLDELQSSIIVKRIIDSLNNKNIKIRGLVVFGSMTFVPYVLRKLNGHGLKIIYDPLSNYAQTLYFTSKKSFLAKIKYGLYLAIHKKQLGASDLVVYPSSIDEQNALKMFNPRKHLVIGNPFPFCFNDIKYYLEQRNKRKDFDKPYFILTAGGRGNINSEAVKITVNVFNHIDPSKFHLFITGPWKDMESLIKNDSIELTGKIQKKKLMQLLAMSDYGLSPIFNHVSGTFLKVLGYLAAGLDIIASTYSLMGLDIHSVLKNNIRIFTMKKPDEFKHIVKKIINTSKPMEKRKPLLCSEYDHYYKDIQRSTRGI